MGRSKRHFCDLYKPLSSGELTSVSPCDKFRDGAVGAERLGVSREEILVLGDMENDLAMFRKAGFAVAMGNASEAVKQVANAVTLSNDEDGFAAAIERWVFSA